MSNNDIPFPEGRLVIHQPSIKEISLIGEESFHLGSHYLNFSLDILSEQDKSRLGNKNEFDIFMSMIKQRDNKQFKKYISEVLTIIFPSYLLEWKEDRILLKRNDGWEGFIDTYNFAEFKDILSNMFRMKEMKNENDYNPADAHAAKIAEKLRKAKERKAKAEGKSLDNINILQKYVSILTVGEQKDMNSLMELTIPQLYDEFKRFQLKMANDIHFQAQLAGAQNLQEVDNWME